MSKIALSYYKNPDYSSQSSNLEPEYFASIDLHDFGIKTNVDELPIYFRMLDKPMGAIRVVYSSKVFGLPIEAGNITRLGKLIEDYLNKLIRFHRLPEYVFQINGSAWPIYRLDNTYITRYPGGLVFSAETIQELHEWLSSYFKGTGRISQPEELNLLKVSHSDLGLYTQ